MIRRPVRGWQNVTHVRRLHRAIYGNRGEGYDPETIPTISSEQALVGQCRSGDARALPFARKPDAERLGLGAEEVILQLDELAEV